MARDGSRVLRRQPADFPLGHVAWRRIMEEHPREYMGITPLCTVISHDGGLVFNAITPHLCHCSVTAAFHLLSSALRTKPSCTTYK